MPAKSFELQNDSQKAPQPKSGAGSLRVGRLLKAHGLKGGIKIELYTDNPELRFYDGAVFHLQVPKESAWFGKSLKLTTLKFYNGMPVAFFDEIVDRTAAESVIRAILWIDEAEVQSGQEEDAWYDSELVGMSVIKDGEQIGTVVEVLHMPAQDLLSIDTGVTKVLVPFVKEIVPEVDQLKREIRITPPEGLIETSEENN